MQLLVQKQPKMQAGLLFLDRGLELRELLAYYSHYAFHDVLSLIQQLDPAYFSGVSQYCHIHSDDRSFLFSVYYDRPTAIIKLFFNEGTTGHQVRQIP